MGRVRLPLLRVPRFARPALRSAVETGRIEWTGLRMPFFHFPDAGMPLPGWCGLGWKESANAAVTILDVRADRPLLLDRDGAGGFAAVMAPALVGVAFRIDQECEAWPSRAGKSTRTFDGSLRLETTGLRVTAAAAEDGVLHDVVIDGDFPAWRARLAVEGLDRIRLGLVNTLLNAERVREAAATRLLALLAAGGTPWPTIETQRSPWATRC